MERKKEKRGINESPTKSSRTHGLDYWWALAKLPDATPGARARSEVEVVSTSLTSSSYYTVTIQYLKI